MPGGNTGDSLLGAAAYWLAKMRSTLVIRRKELPQKEWWERDQISFLLGDAGVSEAAGEHRGGKAPGSECVVLDGQRPWNRTSLTPPESLWSTWRSGYKADHDGGAIVNRA